ncbi:MAG: aconitase family protein [Adlercreutzia equolifaciens]
MPPGQGISSSAEHRASSPAWPRSLPAGAARRPMARPGVYFDTLVGTDSHTPTANGIGVLGWGVGGIEADESAPGQPITTLVPRVVGVKLTGDAVRRRDGHGRWSLTFAQMLRATRRGWAASWNASAPGVAALTRHASAPASRT